jgi:hypothetical protein
MGEVSPPLPLGGLARAVAICRPVGRLGGPRWQRSRVLYAGPPTGRKLNQTPGFLAANRVPFTTLRRAMSQTL